MPADKKKLALLTLKEDSSFTQFLRTNFFGTKIDGCVWTSENQNEGITITAAIDEIIKVDGDSASCFYNTETGSLTYYTKDGGSIDLSNLNNTYTTNTTTATTIAYGNAYTYTNYDQLKDLEKRIDKLENKEKENNMKTNDMFNFDFGPVSGNFIRMSMYGYAVPNSAGKFVSYDIEHKRIMDVQILNFNCEGMFYKIPKPLTKVVEGDVVFHNNVPMFVIDADDGKFTVIDPHEGVEKTILPAHSPFGFDYMTCLVSLMDGFDVPANEDNPFGNMLPFILMSNGQTSDQTLPLMMMMNGKVEFDNPMMLAMLFGNNGFKMDNPFMAMAMMKMLNK